MIWYDTIWYFRIVDWMFYVSWSIFQSQYNHNMTVALLCRVWSLFDIHASGSVVSCAIIVRLWYNHVAVWHRRCSLFCCIRCNKVFVAVSLFCVNFRYLFVIAIYKYVWQKSLQDFINEARERIESKSLLREQNLSAAGLFEVLFISDAVNTNK